MSRWNERNPRDRTLAYPGARREIAEVLAREQGRSIEAVWDEACRLYEVRFEQRVLPPEREK